MTGITTMDNNNNKKGFTLIELIVVMSIFLFIIGAAIGIFLSIIEYQKRLLSEQELLNQVSYAEEYMSKALRVAKKELNENCLVDNSPTPTDHPGYIYLLTRPYTDPSGQTFYRGIKFINQSDNDACEEFFLGNYLGVSTNPLVLQEIKTINGVAGSPTALTPTNLNITSFKLSINGADGSVYGTGCTANQYGCGACDDPAQCGTANSSIQPRLTMLLDIQIPGDNQEPTRIIQTTVSQRNLNAK